MDEAAVLAATNDILAVGEAIGLVGAAAISIYLVLRMYRLLRSTF